MASNPYQIIQARNQRAQAAKGVPFDPRLQEFYPDEYLIRVLVEHGQPKWAAEELRMNPQVRAAALQFTLDVEDARTGDKQAKQRVNFIKEQWAAMRKEELLADDPVRMFDHKLDPRELL